MVKISKQKRTTQSYLHTEEGEILGVIEHTTQRIKMLDSDPKNPFAITLTVERMIEIGEALKTFKF